MQGYEAQDKMACVTPQKPRIMSQSTFDLIRGWHAECALLEDKITRLRSGDLGRYLPAQERHAAIIHLAETVAEFQSLIKEFSQHDDIPITFPPAKADAPKPIQRLRYSPQPHSVGASLTG